MDNHPTDFTDFTEYTKYLTENVPDIVEQFEEGYEDPIYDGNTCGRCFCVVSLAQHNEHNAYHRALSLALYALGSGLRSLVTELGLLDEKSESTNE